MVVKWVAGGIAGVLTLIVSIVLGVAMSSTAAVCRGGAVDVTGIPADASVGAWDGEQLVNAGHVMNTAAAMGLGVQAQRVGVMTAMGESSLRNIGYGDWETDGVTNPDGSRTTSIGLFQQQESWGSTVDRMDPATSARLFFERLITVDGWETLPPSRAAHRVQINADPDHYTKWWEDAVEVTDTLARTYGTGGAGTACTTAGEIALPLDPPYVLTSGFGPRDIDIPGASKWHPAVDLVGSCGDPIYAILPGRVTVSNRLWLSVRSPDGFTVSYLHSPKQTRSVDVGDDVTAGQAIARVGNEPPSGGCHLDIRIHTTGTTNPAVAALRTFPEAPGYVRPDEFFQLHGVDICDPEWCRHGY